MHTEDDCEKALLGCNDPAPFSVINTAGKGTVVLLCDHASNKVPSRLNCLGLSADVLNTHIAWDPGAAFVAKYLSIALDSVLILSGYSRLVIDCNRPLESQELIPEHSAGTYIPGNRKLSLNAKKKRIEEVFLPYHHGIDRLLDEHNGSTVLISIHSFVPELYGKTRPWPIGIAGYRDDRLAHALWMALCQTNELVVGFNEPYAIEEKFDYSLPIHGGGRGLHCAMIEIRQSEIGSIIDAKSWAKRLAYAWNLAKQNLAI